MLKNLISQGDFTFWPVFSTVLFFTVFLAILGWVYLRKDRDHYRHMANLTMDDGPKTGENPHGR